VLLVDGDEASDISSAVEAESGLTMETVDTVAGAADALDDGGIDCIVTRYELPDGSGMEVVDTVRAKSPQTPVVLFTDVPPTEIDTASFEELIVEYLNSELPDAHDRLGFIVDDLISHSAQVGFMAPENEEGRLEALSSYDVDELPIEESFSRLSDLIASHFDASVSFIGLIEEQQENFLACTGADWDSLTREKTICTHSMLQEDVMVVEDVREDSRFSENDTLENLGIRSYAGANMTTPDGHVIGQVCVLDSEPRTYDADERAELQQFAETVMEILELRDTVQDTEPPEAEA
jgi:CheY-like chemotaxis protein/putative methionine-R-sulfoxide reductase with GAF domain